MFNRVPLTDGIGYGVASEAALTAPVTGILANDTEPDGDPLTANLVEGPESSTFEPGPDGYLTCARMDGVAGEFALTYAAKDGEFDVEATQTTITVTRPEELEEP